MSRKVGPLAHGALGDLRSGDSGGSWNTCSGTEGDWCGRRVPQENGKKGAASRWDSGEK